MFVVVSPGRGIVARPRELRHRHRRGDTRKTPSGFVAPMGKCFFALIIWPQSVWYVDDPSSHELNSRANEQPKKRKKV